MPQASLAAKKAKRRLAVSQATARLEDLVTRRTKGSNPVSRDLAAGACGKLTARQPRERGVPRLK